MSPCLNSKIFGFSNQGISGIRSKVSRSFRTQTELIERVLITLRIPQI